MPTINPVTKSLTRPDGSPQYFHVMAKPTGAICNLDWEYCFFISKEALYPGSPFRMSDEVLDVGEHEESGTGQDEDVHCWEVQSCW